MASVSPPIVWSEDHCGGAWLISGYAQVGTALKDPRFSVQRAARWINSSLGMAVCSPGQPRNSEDRLMRFKRILSRSVLFTDGARHARLRHSMQAGFSNFSLAPQVPEISAIVTRLLAQIRSKAEANQSGAMVAQFDFIRDFARPLPALVITGLLGIPSQQQPGFIEAAAAIAGFIGAPTPTLPQALAAQQGLADMQEHFAGAIAARGRDSGDDLLGRLMRGAQEGQLSAAEMLSQCCTLLFAGYETTRHLLGNGLLRLLQHADQWHAVQDSAAGRQNALRELLRFDSPVQYTGRRLLADVDMDGQRLRQGDLVILRIAAANRDPRRFTDPYRLDLARDQGNHLSFGHGPHVCVGARLTYLEADIAFQALSPFMSTMQVDQAGLSWQAFPAYRGLETLPLRWTMASSLTAPVRAQAGDATRPAQENSDQYSHG